VRAAGIIAALRLSLGAPSTVGKSTKYSSVPTWVCNSQMKATTSVGLWQRLTTVVQTWLLPCSPETTAGPLIGFGTQSNCFEHAEPIESRSDRL
jgi:hypothetical protein